MAICSCANREIFGQLFWMCECGNVANTSKQKLGPKITM